MAVFVQKGQVVVSRSDFVLDATRHRDLHAAWSGLRGLLTPKLPTATADALSAFAAQRHHEMPPSDYLRLASDWPTLLDLYAEYHDSVLAGRAAPRLYVMQLKDASVGWGNTVLDVLTHFVVALLTRRAFMLHTEGYFFNVSDYLRAPGFGWQSFGSPGAGVCFSNDTAVDITDVRFSELGWLDARPCLVFQVYI